MTPPKKYCSLQNLKIAKLSNLQYHFTKLSLAFHPNVKTLVCLKSTFHEGLKNWRNICQKLKFFRHHLCMYVCMYVCKYPPLPPYLSHNVLSPLCLIKQVGIVLLLPNQYIAINLEIFALAFFQYWTGFLTWMTLWKAEGGVHHWP